MRVFFFSKSHSLLRRITGGGKRLGYFLKSHRKIPVETVNYKVTTTQFYTRPFSGRREGVANVWSEFIYEPLVRLFHLV